MKTAGHSKQAKQRNSEDRMSDPEAHGRIRRPRRQGESSRSPRASDKCTEIEDVRKPLAFIEM